MIVVDDHLLFDLLADIASSALRGAAAPRNHHVIVVASPAPFALESRTLVRMVWGAVTREDLLSFADSEGAASMLPKLIRRLILETGRGVEFIEVPGGTGISSGGFDGFIRAAHGTPFVPAGRSVWELSVNKNVNTKADIDYQKRASVPDGSPTGDSTCVQVISHKWTNSHNWPLAKKQDGRWSDVRAYGLDRDHRLCPGGCGRVGRHRAIGRRGRPIGLGPAPR